MQAREREREVPLHHSPGERKREREERERGFSLLLPYKAFEFSFPIYRCLANKLPIRGNTTLGHPMLYSRAHPLRIRDAVALTSGPQGLPVALTPEQSKAKRDRDRERDKSQCFTQYMVYTV